MVKTKKSKKIFSKLKKQKKKKKKAKKKLGKGLKKKTKKPKKVKKKITKKQKVKRTERIKKTKKQSKATTKQKKKETKIEIPKEIIKEEEIGKGLEEERRIDIKDIKKEYISGNISEKTEKYMPIAREKYIKRCPECGSINLFWNKEKGEVICKDCGLVIEDKMVDFGPEWREFEDGDESLRRTGAPSTYTQFDQGLGTEIGQKGEIYKLGKQKNKFFRLRKWQYRVSTAIERNLKLALAELKRVSSYLKLPKSVEEEAARIYTLAVQRGLVRGRSMESVVAGSLYAACRRHEVPRTLDEISEASGIDKREVGRTYRFVTRELNITILPSNPVDYIARFSSSLKLSPATQSKSIEILEKAQKKELTSGRGPTGIAAAALYVSALLHGEKRTQREVADVAGVTEVTIRNRYKELLDKLDLEKEVKKVKKKKERSL